MRFIIVPLLFALLHAGVVCAAESTEEIGPGAFGVCNSAEGRAAFPKYFPILREAGVTVFRGFPEWQSLQPTPDTWNFDFADKLVASAKENDIEILATFGFLTKWASSGGTRTFPIKDMKHWRAYVKKCVERYHKDITYWGVYNEFQGFSKNGTPKDYMQLLVDSYKVAKAVDPKVKIGLATSSVDISFLEEVIRLGGADHFDWIDIHPYELLGSIHNNREYVFLGIMDSLRKMLKKYKQRDDIEILAGEIGHHTKKNSDYVAQADTLVKAYVLGIAQGMKSLFWFEARGPYKMGLISNDDKWEKRPAYHAMQQLSNLLGTHPEYLGWYNPTGNSYGFLFKGATQPVLVMWSMTPKGDALTFETKIVHSGMNTAQNELAGGAELSLTKDPTYISGLSANLINQIKANKEKAFPWIRDYSDAEKVVCRMGAANTELGLMLNDKGDGLTVLEIMQDGSYARRTNKRGRKNYMYFDVDDSYAAAGDHEIEITITARAADPKRGAAMNLTYESTNKYRDTKQSFQLPKNSNEWQDYTFKLSDANFGNSWGWNFRIRVAGSPGDVLVQQVAVKRISAKK